MSEIICRGCATSMEKRVLTTTDGRRQATLDVCPTCHSIFVEEFELSALSEPLARLPFRQRPAAQVELAPGQVGCPGCGRALDKVPVSGVEVELCCGCHGVWLDAGELEALRERAEGSPGRDPYRTSVTTENLGTGMTRCASCEALVEMAGTMILPSGLVCGPCFYAREEKRLEREGNRPLIALTPGAKDGGAEETHWLLAGMRSVLHAMSNQGEEPWERAVRPKPPPGPDARACDACTAARGMIVLRGSAECSHD